MWKHEGYRYPCKCICMISTKHFLRDANVKSRRLLLLLTAWALEAHGQPSLSISACLMPPTCMDRHRAWIVIVHLYPTYLSDRIITQPSIIGLRSCRPCLSPAWRHRFFDL